MSERTLEYTETENQVITSNEVKGAQIFTSMGYSDKVNLVLTGPDGKVKDRRMVNYGFWERIKYTIKNACKI